MKVYRPNGQQWQIIEVGPLGGMYPGRLYPTVEALLKEHPGAEMWPPQPVLPPDIKH